MRLSGVLTLLLCSGAAGADALSDYLFSQDQLLRDRLQMPAAPKAPWIDEAELRLAPEQDAASLGSETYSIRFRPTSGKERDAKRRLFSVDNELASIEWQESLSSALLRRYVEIIALAELEVRAAVLHRQLLLDRSAFAAQNAMSASSGFSSAELQDSALRVERRVQQLHQAMSKTTLLRAATVGDLLAVEHDVEPAVSPRLILPEQVGSMLDSIASKANAFDNSRAQTQVRRAQTEIALEKSRSRFGINLLELSYEDKALDSYKVTLGFRIPLGRDDFGVQERMRDANVARQHAFLIELLVEEKLQAAIREMRWEIDSYHMDKTAIRALQERIASTPTDVASLVSLRQHQLDLMESAAASHLDLLRDYADLLHMLGALQQQRNWIRSS